MNLRARSGLEPSPRLQRPAVVLDAVSGAATGMVDRAGRAVVPGSAVLVRDGEHAGRVAEVVGWGGRRGVEVVVCDATPAFLALPAALLESVDVALLDPIVPRRRRRGRSASAGGARQATNRAAGEPEAGGAIPSGAGGGPATRRDHQHQGLRRLAQPEGGLQPGLPQPPQVAPEG